MKQGAYRAKPTVRHYIDKPDGRKRPIGICVLEDKIVQRATTEVMNAIYERDFLGFTHICGKTRKGKPIILRKTISSKLQNKLKEVYTKLRRCMHYPIPVQGGYLRSVVAGHVRYYGVPSNSSALSVFRKEICRMWYKILRRRSQKSKLIWERMKRLIAKWIPKARICHPYPNLRLSVTT